MSRRPRARLVTQWWPPEPVTVPVWIARALSERGWDVEILTGLPNYPSGIVAEGYSPRRYMREVSAGFRVTRAPLYPNHGTSAVKRMANYLSWATAATAPALALKRVDVNVVYASPAIAALPAMVAKAVRRTPYVLIAQDIWPDSVTRGGFLRPSRLTCLVECVLGWFVCAAYSGASAVSVISPGAQDLLAARGVPHNKLSLIYNWVDEEIFAPQARNPVDRAEFTGNADDFVLLYAGNLGRAQGLTTAIDAIAMSPARVRLVIAGDGVEEHALRQHAARVAPERVRFLGRQPMAEMSRLTSSADAQLVMLRDLPLYRTTMPSKVQAVLASGSAVICTVPGDAADVVRRSGAGLVAVPDDPKALSEAIVAMADMNDGERAEMGRRAREFYEREMAEAVGGRRLDGLLRTVLVGSEK
jgi:colanic acid biosynthesis glycosyl transferase WcaI